MYMEAEFHRSLPVQLHPPKDTWSVGGGEGWFCKIKYRDVGAPLLKKSITWEQAEVLLIVIIA